MATLFTLTAFSLGGEQLGASKRIAALPIRVGRNGLNDFVVNHNAVSSFHARIEDIEGRLCITDLASKNGTRLASGAGIPQQIPPNQAFDLQPAGFQFFLGVNVRVAIAFEQVVDSPGSRGALSFSGAVVGNAGALLDGVSQPSPPPSLGSPGRATVAAPFPTGPAFPGRGSDPPRGVGSHGRRRRMKNSRFSELLG